MNQTIRRGDICLVRLYPVVGSEMDGIRPAVVIQNDVGNHFSSTTIVAPFTTRLRRLTQPTHVLLKNFHEAGMKQESVSLAEQVRTIDKSRIYACTGRLPEEIMEELDMALSVSLGLDSDRRMDMVKMRREDNVQKTSKESARA